MISGDEFVSFYNITVTLKAPPAEPPAVCSPKFNCSISSIKLFFFSISVTGAMGGRSANPPAGPSKLKKTVIVQ